MKSKQQMNTQTTKRISKFLSLVLRHQPQTIGIELDSSGWVDVAVLLTAMNEHPAGKPLSAEVLDEVVTSNDKQRFEFSPDRKRIRARQGHSVDVDLGYQPATPPETLLHGTPDRFVSSIRASGLKKMKRHHVHMHVDTETSLSVGARRGKPVLLKIRAGEMHQSGHKFFVTENNVWLTDHVPPEFIDFPEGQA